MKTSLIAVSFFAVLWFCLVPFTVQAEPNYNNLGIEYDDSAKMTVVSAKEKLIDATTGLGAAYNFPGRVIHQLPKMVDLSFYGYHETVQWQNIKTLTVFYDGHSFTNKVYLSLHGEDRDRSQDLVESKYFESVLIQLPIDIARQVSRSTNVMFTSSPESLNFQISEEQMDRCRDLINTIPNNIVSRPPIHMPDMNDIAGSRFGLPITREITESTSDAELTMPLFAITGRFGMSGLAFVTISGRKVREPTEALLIMELADTPALETEQEITLNYGDTHLVLTSNTNHTNVESTGIKCSTRTYLIAYSRFLTISKVKSLSFTVGDTIVTIPYQKMAGIREMARRIQH